MAIGQCGPHGMSALCLAVMGLNLATGFVTIQHLHLVATRVSGCQAKLNLAIVKTAPHQVRVGRVSSCQTRHKFHLTLHQEAVPVVDGRSEGYDLP